MRRAGSPAQPGRRNHDGVASLLTRAAQSSAGAYLLVDPFLATWRQARDRLRIPVSNDVTVVKVGYAGITDDHCPHLIRWKSTDDTWLRHSMMLADEEQADGGQESVKGLMISGWLFSDEAPATIAHHLARISTLRHPKAGRCYLRWADRRVLEWMWPSFSSCQRRRLLGPINAWYTLNRRGGLIEYQTPKEEREPEEHFLPPLTMEQWRRAEQGQLVQTLLRGWAGGNTEALPEDYLLQAGNAIQGALTLDLSRQRDVLLLAGYTLQVHPRLAEHPSVIEVVQRSRKTGVPLQAALQEIEDPSGWERIRKELSEHAPRQGAAIDRRESAT
nr:DUF4123 domain-containing protein [Alloalcanivorax xenomutans]